MGGSVVNDSFAEFRAAFAFLHFALQVLSFHNSCLGPTKKYKVIRVALHNFKDLRSLMGLP